MLHKYFDLTINKKRVFKIIIFAAPKLVWVSNFLKNYEVFEFQYGGFNMAPNF